MDSPKIPRTDTQPRPAVLVVDDEPAVRGLPLAALPPQGFTVFAAADGREAVTVFQQHQAEIAAVLLDVQLPGMDGPQILKALREINPALRCCFMTGNPGRYAEEELLSLGAACIIRKPFQLAELAQVLRELVVD